MIQEQVRHYEIVEIGKETDAAAELHRRLAAECSGATKAIREFAEKGLHSVFEKIAKDLDEGQLTLDEATKARTYLSMALHEANKVGRGMDAQRLREEGAAGVLAGLIKRLEVRRDAAVAKIDAFAKHEKAKEATEGLSIGGAFRGGIMAQRRAERLAEEAVAPSLPPEADVSEGSIKKESEEVSANCVVPGTVKNLSESKCVTSNEERLEAFTKQTSESIEKVVAGKARRAKKAVKNTGSAAARAKKNDNPSNHDEAVTSSETAKRKLAESARKLGFTGRQTKARPVENKDGGGHDAPSGSSGEPDEAKSIAVT